jgi:hypothetical protein
MGKTDIIVNFDKNQVKSKEELNGVIKIKYPGRFDSIVINSQIENTSDTFSFTKLNGKKIIYSYARMPILRQDIKEGNEIEFTVRVSIIQEHKEVADDVAFLKIVP